MTVTDTYSMEDVRATLDWMGTEAIFSTFDLKDGVFQIELEEGSRDLSAIHTVSGLLRYLRLPQGMKNSPAAFQRVVNFILGNRKGMDIWAFMDDVSLGTATADEHLQPVDLALKTFYDAGARLKLSKCQFGVRKAEILGHQIDQNGIKPSHAHVGAIRRLVEPGGGEELMRFFGLMNFFLISLTTSRKLPGPFMRFSWVQASTKKEEGAATPNSRFGPAVGSVTEKSMEGPQGGSQRP